MCQSYVEELTRVLASGGNDRAVAHGIGFAPCGSMLPLLLAPLGSAGLAYLFCYGGVEGPIDWAMSTDSPRLARSPAHRADVRRWSRSGAHARAARGAAPSWRSPRRSSCSATRSTRTRARRADRSRRSRDRQPHLLAPVPAAEAIAHRRERARRDRCGDRAATGITPTLACDRPYGGRSPRNVRAMSARRKACRPVGRQQLRLERRTCRRGRAASARARPSRQHHLDARRPRRR